MTPKEKAKELLDKFYIEVLDRDGTSSMHGIEAKQCALIVVDEIVKEYCSLNYGDYFDENLKYWQEVKQEIQKL